MSQPIHIVMTPTRNEAWVIRAFLESTTRWADYVIICDQFSTDGTREIVADFAKRQSDVLCMMSDVSRSAHRCKVILIDNPNTEFNEAERQRILVAKAREVAAGRDTLLWGLDADEILAANAFSTGDWQKIMHSKPGAVFWFQWAYLSPDRKKFNVWPPAPWLFHDDGVEPHGNYVRDMHSMRIPYPKEENDTNYVTDFYVLHLALLNQYRINAKWRFYQIVDWELHKRSPIALSRIYSNNQSFKDADNISSEMIYTTERDGFNMLELIDTSDVKCYLDDYVYAHLQRHSIEQMRRLDIWNKEFICSYQLVDPRRWIDKLVHAWLHVTLPYRSTIIVKAIDKILKIIY